MFPLRTFSNVQGLYLDLVDLEIWTLHLQKGPSKLRFFVNYKLIVYCNYYKKYSYIKAINISPMCEVEVCHLLYLCHWVLFLPVNSQILFMYYVFYVLPVCKKWATDHNTDGFESLCCCWVLNTGPLKEQPLLLSSEPSLHPTMRIPRRKTRPFCYEQPYRLTK